MNTNNTLHDKILAASKEIAADKGFQAINIRAVASKAKISVGSVYNYFPDKSALLQATIADIWCDVFHRTGQCTALSSVCFGLLFPLTNAAASIRTSLLLTPSAFKKQTT